MLIVYCVRSELDLHIIGFFDNVIALSVPVPRHCTGIALKVEVKV